MDYVTYIASGLSSLGVQAAKIIPLASSRVECGLIGPMSTSTAVTSAMSGIIIMAYIFRRRMPAKHDAPGYRNGDPARATGGADQEPEVGECSEAGPTVRMRQPTA